MSTCKIESVYLWPLSPSGPKIISPLPTQCTSPPLFLQAAWVIEPTITLLLPTLWANNSALPRPFWIVKTQPFSLTNSDASWDNEWVLTITLPLVGIWLGNETFNELSLCKLVEISTVRDKFSDSFEWIVKLENGKLESFNGELSI